MVVGDGGSDNGDHAVASQSAWQALPVRTHNACGPKLRASKKAFDKIGDHQERVVVPEVITIVSEESLRQPSQVAIFTDIFVVRMPA